MSQLRNLSLEARVRIGFLVGTLLALILCAAVATRTWTLGSLEGGWTYQYVRRPFPVRQLWVFAVLALSAAGLLLLPLTRRTVWLNLAIWILFATGAHWVLRSHYPAELEMVFVSPAANSFYTTAQDHGPSDLLARFNRIRRDAPWHGRSNMPGKTLLVHVLTTITPRTELLPWLLIAVSNLGALIIFGLARDLFDSSRAALYAAVLYLFTPARVVFFPLMNTVTPLFALGCAWLLVRWLKTGASIYPVALGVALYALVFFEPLPLVMGLLFLMLVAGALARREIAWERFLFQGCASVVVFIATYEAVLWTTGFDLFPAFRQIGAHAVEFNALEARPYGIWVRANLAEFLFGAGPLQMILALVALGYRAPGDDWRASLRHPPTLVCAGLFAVLVTTNLIGLNRGEVVRLWIFLACFFQLPAAYLCATATGRLGIIIVVGATLLQLSLAGAMIRFIVT